MGSSLEMKIQEQIEYYFGDNNLPRDKFLQNEIKKNDGWVSLDIMLRFNRLSDMTKNKEFIAAAIEKSENELVELSSCRTKIRRSPHCPLPVLNLKRKEELMDRTAFAKGFPINESMDEIFDFLKDFGETESFQRCTYLDKKRFGGPALGSCYIVFKTKEDCKKFIDAECVKYKGTDLVRKWQAIYLQRTRNVNSNLSNYF